MALATICKQFIFHAAHQLPNHDGPCRRLHGHTYRMEVLVTGAVHPPSGESDEGMVLDFAELKRIYIERIEPRVEHQFLNDTIELPTSENIALWLYNQFAEGLAHGRSIGSGHPIQGLCVRLWESPTSFAEVGTAPWRG